MYGLRYASQRCGSETPIIGCMMTSAPAGKDIAVLAGRTVAVVVVAAAVVAAVVDRIRKAFEPAVTAKRNG